MIRQFSKTSLKVKGKPRASGDDPVRAAREAATSAVNPARAGMIPPPPVQAQLWGE